MVGTWRGFLNEESKGLPGKLLFQFTIIFIGMTAAFAVDQYRQDRADRAYREQTIAALIPTLDDSAPPQRDNVPPLKSVPLSFSC